jgi:long-chain acyl-CoA synthetase
MAVGQSVVGFARLAELALIEGGLSLTQYRILQHLQHSNTIQSDLAFQLTVTKQSVTRLVDGLVNRGFIARTVDEDDRRRVIHAITPKGRRAFQRSNDIVEDFLMAVLQDLDDDASIETARKGIRLFGVAAEASRERVGPNGIVPGPRTRRAQALDS